jgi:hypothetical protein
VVAADGVYGHSDGHGRRDAGRPLGAAEGRRR